MPCDTEFMRRTELELHLGVMEHMQRFVDEEKDKLIENVIPVKAPVCDSCPEYFCCESDLKIHDRYSHKKDNGFNADQIENLKALSQSRNLSLKPFLDRVYGRILQILPSGEFGIIQVSEENDRYINVLFDLSRLEMPNKRSSLAESVVPGYPVLLTAVQMEPPVPGYSENIPYYASAVTIGDEDEHSGLLMQFSTLRTSLGSALAEGQGLSRAAIAVQLDMLAQGLPTPLFHTLKDQVEFGTGIVVMKNQSVLLVRLQQDHCYALQILESVLLTDTENESSGETFEVGDSLHLNCVLMNPAHPTQYLITGCWSSEPRPSIPRSSLTLRAVDMYRTLAASYCRDPGSCSVLEMSSVLVPSASGVGFDDIAADGDDICGSVDDIEDDLAAEPAPFKPIMISSFARQSN